MGRVERDCCGLFADPEGRAYGESLSPRQPLYRVRFFQLDLWEGYAGSETDTVDVEVYQVCLQVSLPRPPCNNTPPPGSSFHQVSLSSVDCPDAPVVSRGLEIDL